MFSEDYPYVLIKFYAYSINQLGRNVWVLGIFVRFTRAIFIFFPYLLCEDFQYCNFKIVFSINIITLIK